MLEHTVHHCFKGFLSGDLFHKVIPYNITTKDFGVVISLRKFWTIQDVNNFPDGIYIYINYPLYVVLFKCYVSALDTLRYISSGF